MLLKYLAKVAVLAMLGIGLLAAPGHAAGTIPLAMSIQLDNDGSVAANCQATFYQAGTVATKQNVYADFSLTQPLANPLPCSQSGRLPMFWLADGLIHVRLMNAAGNPIIDTTMQVLGPSSGGGGGGSTVDPTTLMATGDQKLRYGTGPLSGFVRANGLTIGNASSGASERANADTQALFVYLCGVDANLVMTPPRSGNCLSDFNANKQLATPDVRGRVIAGLDDMGNSAAGRLTSVGLGVSGTVLGNASASETVALTLPNLPPITPSGTVSVAASFVPFRFATIPVGGGSSVTVIDQISFVGNNGSTSLGSPAASFTGGVGGGSSSPFSRVQPTILMTVYIKL